MTCEQCNKNFEVHVKDEREGEIDFVFYKMRGNHGYPTGVRVKGKVICSSCHERSKEEK